MRLILALCFALRCAQDLGGGPGKLKRANEGKRTRGWVGRTAGGWVGYMEMLTDLISWDVRFMIGWGEVEWDLEK